MSSGWCCRWGMAISLIFIALITTAVFGETAKRNVLMIGVDGLAAQHLRTALDENKAPHLARLMGRPEFGGITFNGRAVMPTLSKPNWAALFTSGGPEETGVRSNHWYPLESDLGEHAPCESAWNGYTPNQDCIECHLCREWAAFVLGSVVSNDTLSEADMLDYALRSCGDATDDGVLLPSTCTHAAAHKFPFVYTAAIAVEYELVRDDITGAVKDVCGHDHAQMCMMDVPPVTSSVDSVDAFQRFPTLFRVAHEHGVTSSVYTDHEIVLNLVESGVAEKVTLFDSMEEEVEQYEEAVDMGSVADITFLHFDHIDDVGHQFGWGSVEYIEAVSDVDVMIGRAIDALYGSQEIEDPFIVLMSDHGGVAGTHGPTTTDTMLVPVALWGVGIIDGDTRAVNQLDIPATVAHVMDLTAPNEWRGIPLTEPSGCPYEKSDAPAPVDIVVVMAVDGLSANDIEGIVLSKDSESGQYSAEYQYMQWMMEHGASTLNARLEMPATPLVGAASLLFGTTPEMHGVLDDGWLPAPASPTLKPRLDLRSILRRVHDLAPNRTSALMCLNEASQAHTLLALDETTVVDAVYRNDTDYRTLVQCLQQLNSAVWTDDDDDGGEQLMYIELAELGRVKREHGRRSGEFREELHRLDLFMRTVLNSINRKNTMVILTGIATGEGNGPAHDSIDALRVPWIAVHPNVKGSALRAHVSITDTAATVYEALTLRRPCHTHLLSRPVMITYSSDVAASPLPSDASGIDWLSVSIVGAVGVACMLCIGLVIHWTCTDRYMRRRLEYQRVQQARRAEQTAREESVADMEEGMMMEDGIELDNIDDGEQETAAFVIEDVHEEGQDDDIVETDNR